MPTMVLPGLWHKEMLWLSIHGSSFYLYSLCLVLIVVCKNNARISSISMGLLDYYCIFVLVTRIGFICFLLVLPSLSQWKMLMNASLSSRILRLSFCFGSTQILHDAQIEFNMILIYIHMCIYWKYLFSHFGTDNNSRWMLPISI